MLIVDLDKTLVASGFYTVLASNPEPVFDSVRVMGLLARRYTIIYLTHRPDCLGPKSKSWLAENGYPDAPLLMPNSRTFLKGSESYKSSIINEIRRRFPKLEIGIGDKTSDAKAYHDNGIRSFLLIYPEALSSARELQELSVSLQVDLASEVQVVTGWWQIEQAVFQGKSYPRDRMIQRLGAMAERLSPMGQTQ